MIHVEKRTGRYTSWEWDLYIYHCVWIQYRARVCVCPCVCLLHCARCFGSFHALHIYQPVIYGSRTVWKWNQIKTNERIEQKSVRSQLSLFISFRFTFVVAFVAIVGRRCCSRWRCSTHSCQVSSSLNADAIGRQCLCVCAVSVAALPSNKIGYEHWIRTWHVCCWVVVENACAREPILMWRILLLCTHNAVHIATATAAHRKLVWPRQAIEREKIVAVRRFYCVVCHLFWKSQIKERKKCFEWWLCCFPVRFEFSTFFKFEIVASIPDYSIVRLVVTTVQCSAISVSHNFFVDFVQTSVQRHLVFNSLSFSFFVRMHLIRNF